MRPPRQATTRPYEVVVTVRKEDDGRFAVEIDDWSVTVDGLAEVPNR